MPLDLIFQNGSLTTLVPPTSPNILYVNGTTGNDSRTKEQAQNPATPWKTIQNALNIIGFVSGAGADITIIVANGTYNEQVNDWPSGTSGHPFTLKSATQYGATISPTVGPGSGGALNIDNVWIVIDGFLIDGTNVQGNLVTVEATATNLVFKNNLVQNIYSAITLSGIYVAGADNITILDNIIHDIAVLREEAQSHGIYLDVNSLNALIDGNTIYNGSGFGMQILSGSNNLIIRNNRIYDYGMAEAADSAGIYTEGDNNLIYNNIIFQTGAVSGSTTGIATIGNATLIYNNTIVGVDYYAIRIAANNTNVRNNIFYQASPAEIDEISGTGHIINTNLLNATNPLFVNLGTFNLHLTSSSPAKDAGVTIASVPDDFDGATRPQGSAYCIGAYEFI